MIKYWRQQSKTFLKWGRKQPPNSKNRVSYRINPRRNTPRHILIKLTKLNTKKEY